MSDRRVSLPEKPDDHLAIRILADRLVAVSPETALSVAEAILRTVSVHRTTAGGAGAMLTEAASNVHRLRAGPAPALQSYERPRVVR